MKSPAPDSDLEQRLQALRTAFAESLPDRKKAIADCWNTVQASDWSVDAVTCQMILEDPELPLRHVIQPSEPAPDGESPPPRSPR